MRSDFWSATLYSVDEIKAEFIERYQQMYARDPKSKVFAPLAEAYRKLGLLSQAEQICKQGVKLHPDFVSGLVAYAKVLIDQKKFTDALPHLMKSTQLSPDNILSHRLLALCQLSLRQPKEALRSFKMVLFLSPEDEEAQRHVQKWESLTADEYEADFFETPTVADPTTLPLAQKHVALVDAYIVRQSYEQASLLIEQGLQKFSDPELIKRKKLLENLSRSSPATPQRPIHPGDVERIRSLELKKKVLESLLQRFI